MFAVHRSSWVAVAVVVMMVASGLAIFGWAGASSPAPAAVAAPGVSALAAPLPAASTGSAAPATGFMTPSGIWDGPLKVNTQLASAVDKARAASEANGVPAADILLPNVYAPPAPTAMTGGHIVPNYPYPNAPAPMGVAYYGIQNVGGQLQGTILNTTSLEGYMYSGDPTGVQGLYFDAGGQQTYGAQLNAVIANMTLFGQSGYQVWSQNVLNYNPLVTTNQLTIFNALWNFSSTSVGWATRNTVLSGNGTVSVGSDYQVNNGAATEAKITVTFPFSLAMYMNLSVNRAFSSSSGSCVTYGCNVVYFNYSVWGASGALIKHGSFDTVIFNSQAASHPVYLQAGTAQFQANGLAYNPYVDLPDDWEMDYGIGYDGGSQMNMQYANASVGVYYLNATTQKFQDIPSAYNYGSETGEDGSGMSIGWTTSHGQPIAVEATGPSIVQGLWNITGGVPSGMYPVNYAGVTPGNAFIAYAPGAAVANESMFKVAPTFGWFTPRGSIGPNTYLPPGTYTVQVMLSGYDQQTLTITLGPSGVVLTNHLVRDAAAGVYTPEWAFSSTDLANLSSSGSGTAGSPYVVSTVQTGSLSLAFGDVESYLFPVWLGIYLNSTTAHVNFDPAPSMSITYPGWSITGKVQTYFAPAAASVPLTGQFQLYLYHAQNVTIAHAASIGGWFSNEEVGRKYNAYVSSGKNDLFYRDLFNVSSEGIDITGGSNNVVWGSTFTPWSQPTAYPGIETPTTGLTDAENGADHIYNNAFYTNGTAAASSSNHEYWNVTGGTQPTSFVYSVNGYALTGANILGQNYEGGNYWFNYGATADPYGVIPYVARASSPTGSAAIGFGGDFAPLSPYGKLAAGLYHVTFTETGAGTGSWGMRWTAVPVSEPVYSTTYTTNPSNTTTISASVRTNGFWLPNGTYTWTAVVSTSIGPASGFLTGTVTVNGANVGVPITLAQLYVVTFTESGLVSPNVRWYLNVTGQNSVTSTATTLPISLANGTSPTGFYKYTLAAGTNLNYRISAAVGSFNVSGTTVAKSVTFTPVTFAVAFAETGLPGGTPWYVNGTGQASASSTSSSLTANFQNGTIAYTVATANKNWAIAPIHYSIGVAGGPATGPTFVYTPFKSNVVTFTETGLPAWVG
ncbi:MAG: hypothetical protein ABSA15_06970, partial [Thermoplasmata archaeon]